MRTTTQGVKSAITTAVSVMHLRIAGIDPSPMGPSLIRYKMLARDSAIVAAALLSSCKTILVEDLQHGQRIETADCTLSILSVGLDPYVAPASTSDCWAEADPQAAVD